MTITFKTARVVLFGRKAVHSIFDRSPKNKLGDQIKLEAVTSQLIAAIATLVSVETIQKDKTNYIKLLVLLFFRH
jgi:hypothetical protein